MIIKHNVNKPEKYVKDGVEKTFWTNVGTYTKFVKEDGSVSRLLEIPAIGLKAQIFPIDERLKEEKTKLKEEINDEEIPF